MRPSVNRSVHYYAPLDLNISDPLAAIITRVQPVQDEHDRVVEDGPTEENDVKVFLAIFIHTESTQDIDLIGPVPFSREPRPGCWTWPPRA